MKSTFLKTPPYGRGRSWKMRRIAGVARPAANAARQAWGQGGRAVVPAFQMVQQRRSMSVAGIPEPDHKWCLPSPPRMRSLANRGTV